MKVLNLALFDDPARDAVVKMLASYAGLAIGVSILVSGLKSLWKPWVDGKEPVLTAILTMCLGVAAKLVMPDIYGDEALKSWTLHVIVLVFVAIGAGTFHDKILNVFTGKSGAKLVIVAVLAPFLCAGCYTLEREAVKQVQATHAIILPEYIAYVAKDPAFTDQKQKDDRVKLVESLKRLVEALLKQTE